MSASFASLTIYQGKDPIGVEGFRDIEQTAAWASRFLFSDDCPYPGWDGVLPKTHNDYREVLSMLHTVEQMARFLVALDYSRDAITQTLADNFPGLDVQGAYVDAVAHRDRCNAEVDAAIARETEAARAAEHDLSKTMHIDHRGGRQ